MQMLEERWFAVTCNSEFFIVNEPIAKNINIGLRKNDCLYKVVQPDNISKFLDFILRLRKYGSAIDYEIGVLDSDDNAIVMEFRGFICDGKFIISAVSRMDEIYKRLNEINNEHVNMLREKISVSYKSEENCMNFSKLNNEVINMQRELYQKNSQIESLLRESQQLNSELAASNAMKDKLFSIIGHDIRGPIGRVHETIELICSGVFNYDELIENKYFEALKEDLNNAMMLLENLLSWSRCQSGEIIYKPLKFDIIKTIESVLLLFAYPFKSKEIRIVRNYKCSHEIYADERMAETVIRNIVSNALKFSDAKKSIVISVEKETESTVVTVQDEGIGIGNDIMKNILSDKLGSSVNGTKGEKGMGFGLKLCRSLMKYNGGNIEMHSEVGKGTEVKIIFN